MGKEKIKAIIEMENDKIIIKGNVEKLDCSFIDDAILSNVEKVVKYYAERLLNFQHPTCEIEKTDDGLIGFYVFNEADEDIKSKYYYVQIGKIGRGRIVYKIDFTKEDFKLMP